MTTSIDNCSQALVRIGAAPIAALNDGTPEGNLAGALYQSVRDALLSSYPWSFAVKHQLLNTPTTAPTTEYTTAFALPADCLRLIGLGTQERPRGIDYRIRNGVIHTNATSAYLTYICRQAENVTPPYFNAALVMRLSAEFCIPLSEDEARAETLYKLADNELKKARQVDAQQNPPSRINANTLIDARG